ncbi:chromate efflux transporter [Paracoccus endophyticus]|uniref:chromate efflux transporter n=1 Tax=Paracoccus endophyticus TaxID=2233774 RepID=UPI000DD52274|nr:chromate efflux transporter [Paracoccus endophyticus]
MTRHDHARAGQVPPAYPTLAQAVPVWARIAALSFGGPAGQIAVMHRILVEERRWLGDGRFLHALNFCMLLPGPEAMQLATYVGWLMHGVRGALVAGGLFVLPGALSMLALSIVYVLWGGVGIVAGLFFGLKAAVLAIVVQAVVRIGRRALKTPALRAIAAASFLAIAALGVPFPAIVAAAALAGWLGHRARVPGMTGGGGDHGAAGAHVADAATVLGHAPPPATAGARRAGAVALVLWLAPVAALWLALPGSVFSHIALFFSQLAVVTFGGAYAVLAYVAQEAVTRFGWLAPGEMLDGLGLAETTPGPLIMVVQFVGFLAAFREGGGMAAGIAGAALTTWVTFAPCFAWIFLGAPYIERLRHNAALAAALSAVTAAVVGVILNLALWFGWHFVVPDGVLDPWAAVLSLLALALVFGRGWGVMPVMALCAALGMGLRLAGWA